jgi:hypothetical protein
MQLGLHSNGARVALSTGPSVKKDARKDARRCKKKRGRLSFFLTVLAGTKLLLTANPVANSMHRLKKFEYAKVFITISRHRVSQKKSTIQTSGQI